MVRLEEARPAAPAAAAAAPLLAAVPRAEAIPEAAAVPPEPAAAAAVPEPIPAAASEPAAVPDAAPAHPPVGGAAAGTAGTPLQAEAPPAGDSAGKPSALALGLLDAAVERSLSYPAQARRRGVQGTVELEIGVGAAGELERSRVAASSGSGILDSAALKLIRSLFPFAEDLGGAFEARIAIEYRLN